MLLSGLLFLGAGALVAADGSVIRAFMTGGRAAKAIERSPRFQRITAGHASKAFDQSPRFQRIMAVVVCLMIGAGDLLTFQGFITF
jgi:hypothetical protein